MAKGCCVQVHTGAPNLSLVIALLTSWQAIKICGAQFEKKIYLHCTGTLIPLITWACMLYVCMLCIYLFLIIFGGYLMAIVAYDVEDF
jgi:hypothetical protein